MKIIFSTSLLTGKSTSGFQTEQKKPTPFLDYYILKAIIAFSISVLLFPIVGVSQVTSIDFETAGAGYTPSGTVGTGFTDVFNRSNPNIGGNSTFIWAVEDLSLTDPSLTLDQINVTGGTDFTFSLDMLAHHYNDWDSSDGLEIYYSIDGGPQQNLLWVKNNGGTFNELPSLDTNFDGIGDCGVGTLPALTTGTSGCSTSSSNFATFSAATIPLSGNSTLDITFQFIGMTANDEGIYLDNIEIDVTQAPAGCNITSLNLSNIQCNDNGTTTNASDDVTSFELNPIGSDLGATYSVDMDGLAFISTSVSGPFTSDVIGGIPYGSATTFYLDPGSAGIGFALDAIVQDVDDINCLDIASITDPGSCSVAPCSEPSQATNLVLTNETSSSIDISFSGSGADNYLVIQSTVPTLSTNPVDASTYAVSDAIGGGTVVFNGSSTSFTANGLSTSTQYYYFIFAYNDIACSGGPNYETPTLSGNATTLIAPCGTESFDNSNLTSSYSANSYVGDNGVTWTYIESRDESTFGITANGIMLRRDSDNSRITSSPVAGGIQSFTCNLRKAFTGAGNRQVELFVNNISQGTSIAWDNTNVQTFTVNGINISGPVEVEIRNITSNQVIVDDISWSCFASAPCVPTHNVTSFTPTSGPVGTDVTLIGSGFTNATTATIGGQPASVTFVSSTTLIVEIPNGANSGAISIIENGCEIQTGTFTVSEEGNCSTPPVISPLSDLTACDLGLEVTASASNGGTLTYQWYFNDGNSAGWSAVTSALPTGYTIVGENGNNLLIEGNTNPLSDLNGYQFYCEVIEGGTCENVSNAISFEFAPEPFFRSIQNGNWTDPANWEMAPSISGPWVSACVYPDALNSDYISIENGTEISLNIDLNADQIIVQATGVLILNEQLTVENGNVSNSDLDVLGTLQDNGSSVNGIDFINGGTWSLGANGTVIKTWNSSVNNYRDNYETGIANIPASADWAFVYDGSGSVTVGTVGMYYPNLHFESSAGAYIASGFSEIFQGFTDFATVKGNLSIGVGSITGGTDTYTLYNNNLNAQPLLILGDVYIEAGSELSNLDIAGGTNHGLGIEVRGSFLIDGTLDMTNGSGITKLSGTTKQDIVSFGTGTFTTHEFELDNTANTELDGINLEITNTLRFTNGKIITDITSFDIVFIQNSSPSAIVGGVAQSGFSNYVEGKLQWTTDGVSTYTFPIGAAAPYGAQGFTIDLVTGGNNSEILGFLEANNTLPIQPFAYCDLETPISGTGQIGTGIGTPDGVLDQIVLSIESPLQWDITNPDGGISEYNLTVLATGSQDITPVQSTNGLTDIRYLMKNGQPGNPTVTTTLGAPSFNALGFEACPNQYSLSGLTGFSDFTLNGALLSNTALPIELIDFTAEVIRNQTNVLLKWQTASEKNNDYFVLERSADGFNWEDIKQVEGAGTSVEELHYTFIDQQPLNGISYYRLKQIDFDGVFEYFDIRSVVITKTDKELLYRVNTLGQQVDETFKGMVLLYYSDGTTIKVIQY